MLGIGNFTGILSVSDYASVASVNLVYVYLYRYMVTGHVPGAHMIIICVYTVTLNCTCLYLLVTGHAPAIARFRELT